MASAPDGLQRRDREFREIESGLRQAKHRDRYSLKSKSAVRPRDIQRALLEESPQFVHFAGNAKHQSGLIFEDNSGNPIEVSSAALAGLFELFSEIRCVILNGCYSEK
ncbi:MAG TPA: CHAT domain-containing protein, partial [Stenomitos sp.]